MPSEWILCTQKGIALSAINVKLSSKKFMMTFHFGIDPSGFKCNILKDDASNIILNVELP